MDGYIAKPIRAQGLWEVIDKLFPAPPPDAEDGAAPPLVDWSAALDAAQGDFRVLRAMTEAAVEDLPRPCDRPRSGRRPQRSGRPAPLGTYVQRLDPLLWRAPGLRAGRPVGETCPGRPMARRPGALGRAGSRDAADHPRHGRLPRQPARGETTMRPGQRRKAGLLPAVVLGLAASAVCLRTSAQEVRITADLSRPGPAISPYLYGQFIEHLGRCIRDGIWAEKLRDRKFLLEPGKSVAGGQAEGRRATCSTTRPAPTPAMHCLAAAGLRGRQGAGPAAASGQERHRLGSSRARSTSATRAWPRVGQPARRGSPPRLGRRTRTTARRVVLDRRSGTSTASSPSASAPGRPPTPPRSA